MIVFKVKDPTALQAVLEELTEFLLQAGVPSERAFDSKLVACELIGNVFRHEKGEAGFSSEIKDGHIEMKILSKTVFSLPEKIVCSDLLSEHGRGLFLVSELCEGQIFSDKDGIRVRLKIEK